MHSDCFMVLTVTRIFKIWPLISTKYYAIIRRLC